MILNLNKIEWKHLCLGCDLTVLLFWSMGYAKWGSNSIKDNMLHLLLATLGGMNAAVTYAAVVVVAVSVANNK